MIALCDVGPRLLALIERRLQLANQMALNRVNAFGGQRCKPKLTTLSETEPVSE